MPKKVKFDSYYNKTGFHKIICKKMSFNLTNLNSVKLTLLSQFLYSIFFPGYMGGRWGGVQGWEVGWGFTKQSVTPCCLLEGSPLSYLTSERERERIQDRISCK